MTNQLIAYYRVSTNRQEVMTPEGELVRLFTGDPIVSFRQRLNIKFNAAAVDTKTSDVSPLIAGKVA